MAAAGQPTGAGDWPIAVGSQPAVVGGNWTVVGDQRAAVASRWHSLQCLMQSFSFSRQPWYPDPEPFCYTALVAPTVTTGGVLTRAAQGRGP
jgi:hypothetical protein